MLVQAVGCRKQRQHRGEKQKSGKIIEGLRVADAGDKSDDQSIKDAARHQQAMDTLSVFAASLADQMHIDTPPQTDARQQEVTEAFAEISGTASCA